MLLYRVLSRLLRNQMHTTISFTFCVFVAKDSITVLSVSICHSLHRSPSYSPCINAHIPLDGHMSVFDSSLALPHTNACTHTRIEFFSLWHLVLCVCVTAKRQPLGLSNNIRQCDQSHSSFYLSNFLLLKFNNYYFYLITTKTRVTIDLDSNATLIWSTNELIIYFYVRHLISAVGIVDLLSVEFRHSFVIE